MRLRPPAVRLLACAAAAVSAASLLGASSDGSDPTPVTAGIYRGAGIAVRYDVSPPLRSMQPRPVKLPAGPRTEDLMTGFERPAGPQSPDLIVQTNLGEGGIPAPIVSFDGLPITADPSVGIRSLAAPIDAIATDAVAELRRLAARRCALDAAEAS